jgi:hypothetical protein
MTGITAAITALPGQDAIRVLAAIADYQAPLPDPARLRTLDAGLREALATDPAVAG